MGFQITGAEILNTSHLTVDDRLLASTWVRRLEGMRKDSRLGDSKTFARHVCKYKFLSHDSLVKQTVTDT